LLILLLDCGTTSGRSSGYDEARPGAKSRGRDRSPAETPLEFLSILHDLFPCHRDEVDVITRAYLEVHYGGQLDEDAGLAEVRQAWAALQSGGVLGFRMPSITG